VRVEHAPLRRNWDFNLLWTGQVVSDLGTRVADIAFPLLVLAMTGSPARAGIVGFAWTLPLLVLTLHAGALVDRVNRKRLMIVCDLLRCLAFASLVVAILIERVSFGHIVIVALIEGTGFVFFSVAERSALRQVVTDEQLSDALTRNQAREYLSLLGGQPLGGVLFSVGRSVPFLVNSVSYFLSVWTLSLVRAEFQEVRTASPGRLMAEVREGLAWFWRQPFIRATQLLVTGSDFTLNALYFGRDCAGARARCVLASDRSDVRLLGRWRHPRHDGRATARATAQGARRGGGDNVAHSRPRPALDRDSGRGYTRLIYGAMFFLHPTWNAVVGAYRLRMTPDEMQGRVQSVATLLSLGSVPFAALLAGFLLEGAGSTPTVLALSGVMVVVAGAAITSPAIRRAPGN
jgi:transmembrane secretion effector